MKDKQPKIRSTEETVEERFTIRNKLGLHARPAALFVQTANQFDSDILIIKGKQKVNGKSIMGIMTLAAGPGTEIIIRTTGPDAHEALQALKKLLEGNFGE